MKYLFLICCLLMGLNAIAQQKPTDLDKSPMDVSYCPANYPILKMNGKATGTPVARIIYSRPQCNGRKIFGETIVYDQVWRLGANEATEFECFKNVFAGGKLIPKGRYTMFVICTADKWTIIFNTEKDVWGLSYNPKKDVARITVPVQYVEERTEAFTMYFDTAGANGSNLNILWDDIKVVLPFTF